MHTELIQAMERPPTVFFVIMNRHSVLSAFFCSFMISIFLQIYALLAYLFTTTDEEEEYFLNLIFQALVTSIRQKTP